MSYLKEGTCPKCGKKFVWKIDRPGDGFWDRWKSDHGNTLGSWFLTNTLCWDHAMESMPASFRHLLQTSEYSEQESNKKD